MFVAGVAATAVRRRFRLHKSSEPESTVETFDLAVRRALLSKNCTAELTWSLFTLFDVKPEPCWSPRVRSVRLSCHMRSVNEQCDAASNRTLKSLPRDGVWRHPCFLSHQVPKLVLNSLLLGVERWILEPFGLPSVFFQSFSNCDEAVNKFCRLLQPSTFSKNCVSFTSLQARGHDLQLWYEELVKKKYGACTLFDIGLWLFFMLNGGTTADA